MNKIIVIMITIDDNAEIVPGNIIYNPAENARYKVIALGFNAELKTPFVQLDPIPPLGTSTKQFGISIGSMIALGYVLEGEETTLQKSGRFRSLL